MIDAARARLLQVLRLPERPAPPSGAPGSLRVFRAAYNYYRLRVARWVFVQIGALVGIIFAFAFLHYVEADVARVRAAEEIKTGFGDEVVPIPEPHMLLPGGIVRWAARLPPVLFRLQMIIEWVGVAVFVWQLGFSFVALRLDFEMRWYQVTDRSLRIRSGIFTMRESTMSFANIQQVVVTEGPLQRLLGIADVRVRSAGGGGDSSDGGETGEESLHVGVFHGVDNARAIRDLIQERLRLFRETGLGDPDAAPEHIPASPVDAAMPASSEALEAARAVLVEAQALRASLAG